MDKSQLIARYNRLKLELASLVDEASESQNRCAALEAERDKLREFIRYWSYCTFTGMRRECPEKEPEFLEVCRELGIQPYAGSAAGPEQPSQPTDNWVGWCARCNSECFMLAGTCRGCGARAKPLRPLTECQCEACAKVRALQAHSAGVRA